MQAIYIPQIARTPNRKIEITVDEFLPGLESLTPVRGRMVVEHKGNFLEVLAKTETIITLTCDRCLRQYNDRLSLDTSEIIWLDEAVEQPDTGPLERETELDDLVEALSPHGHFQPQAWLYEQMCLALPLRQICDAQCQGVTLNSDGSESTVDSRWGALEALKRQLPGS